MSYYFIAIAKFKKKMYFCKVYKCGEIWTACNHRKKC